MPSMPLRGGGSPNRQNMHPRGINPYQQQPIKKQSKWSAEEDALIIELRGCGMKWDDVSGWLPGRSSISCRLHYQNYLERRSEWDEERKNKLARLYDRFKADMWAKVGEEMGLPWRAAEAMHWQLGETNMAQRAGQTPFTLVAVNAKAASRDSQIQGHAHSQSQDSLTRDLRRSPPQPQYRAIGASPLPPPHPMTTLASMPRSLQHQQQQPPPPPPLGAVLAQISNQQQPRGLLPGVTELTTSDLIPYWSRRPLPPLPAALSRIKNDWNDLGVPTEGHTDSYASSRRPKE